MINLVYEENDGNVLIFWENFFLFIIIFIIFLVLKMFSILKLLVFKIMIQNENF